MAAEPQSAVFSELDRLAGSLPSLGIAVSGGGDSMALLHIAAIWGRARGIMVHAATVDHKLRPEAAAEAAMVAESCAALGVPHRVLAWQHDGDIPGNLMAAARNARLGLLSAWACGSALGAVALGHTQDDQAETVLMRLMRGAGVDGLSGMSAARQHHGVLWLRPMLGVRRAALREWLTQRDILWADDPTNEDASYDRVRVRQAVASLGLPVEQITRSAAMLSEARSALAETAVAAVSGGSADRGVLNLPATALILPEIGRRVITTAIRWITGAHYGPRGDEIVRLIAQLKDGGQGTLDGVIARARGDSIEFLREPAAAARAAVSGSLWDNRWRLDGLPVGAKVGVTQPDDLPCRDWRASGLPRLALLSAPAVTIGDTTVLPLLDLSDVRAIPVREFPDYISMLRAH